MIELTIYDTNGEVQDENKAEFRRQSLSLADIYIICVAADDIDSFKAIDSWAAEIHFAVSSKPIMLLLTKNDIPEARQVVTRDMLERAKIE